MRLFIISLFLICKAFAIETIADGITYEVRKTDEPLTIHILRVDPTKIIIRPVHALNNGFGCESTSHIAKRMGALAAINGGFFKMAGTLKGAPAGILKINSEWYSLPHKPRGAAAWNELDGALTVDRVVAEAKVHIGPTIVRTDNLNSERGDSQAVLFTPAFHRTSLTNPGGKELVVKKQHLVDIKQGINDSKIPSHGFVLSVGRYHPLFNATYRLHDPASFEILVTPLLDAGRESNRIWREAQHIIGGTPVLIKNNAPLKTFSDEQVQETFLTKKHPRTAIGTCGDGTWVFVVVDGRSTLSSLGMTMLELQKLMIDLGCTQALNLDGGASSTMTIKDQVVNVPSGGYDDNQDLPEIDVSDAIVLLPKQFIPELIESK